MQVNLEVETGDPSWGLVLWRTVDKSAQLAADGSPAVFLLMALQSLPLLICFEFVPSLTELLRWAASRILIYLFRNL